MVQKNVQELPIGEIVSALTYGIINYNAFLPILPMEKLLELKDEFGKIESTNPKDFQAKKDNIDKALTKMVVEAMKVVKDKYPETMFGKDNDSAYWTIMFSLLKCMPMVGVYIPFALAPRTTVRMYDRLFVDVKDDGEQIVRDFWNRQKEALEQHELIKDVDYKLLPLTHQVHLQNCPELAGGKLDPEIDGSMTLLMIPTASSFNFDYLNAMKAGKLSVFNSERIYYLTKSSGYLGMSYSPREFYKINRDKSLEAYRNRPIVFDAKVIKDTFGLDFENDGMTGIRNKNTKVTKKCLTSNN